MTAEQRARELVHEYFATPMSNGPAEEVLEELVTKALRSEVVRVLEEVIAEHAAEEELSCGRGYIGAVEVKHLRTLAAAYRDGGVAPEEETT